MTDLSFLLKWRLISSSCWNDDCDLFFLLKWWMIYSSCWSNDQSKLPAKMMTDQFFLLKWWQIHSSCWWFVSKCRPWYTQNYEYMPTFAACKKIVFHNLYNLAKFRIILSASVIKFSNKIICLLIVCLFFHLTEKLEMCPYRTQNPQLSTFITKLIIFRWTRANLYPSPLPLNNGGIEMSLLMFFSYSYSPI